jgi:hypothetical protein
MKHEKPLPKIYTMDGETDPFLYNRRPLAFAWGFYSDDVWEYTWGNNSTDEMYRIIYEMEPGIIFMHNGGRFDIFYWLKYVDIDKPMLIIKTRITVCYIKCRNGWHEVRDSYKIMPYPLSAYKKDEIDYTTFERKVRNKHKTKIVDYLKGDCKYLWELCTKFLEKFGNNVTIGGTAMKELKKFYDTGKCLTESQDSEIREDYYFGARVECFQKGIIKGKKDSIKVYDVNSMYPYVMGHFEHPIGWPSGEGNKIDKETFFITAEGKNYGAFPKRTKEGVKFDIEDGIFNVTIHEWRSALSLGLFTPKRIIRTVHFSECTRFDRYINFFYSSRQRATRDGDKINSLFYKFLLNNSYGRFSINPKNYMDYKIVGIGENLLSEGWTPAFEIEEFGYSIWTQPSKFSKLNNVAIGASITGAARSVIMEAIPKSTRPLYCDTDSLICESLSGVPIDDTKLGAWKLEKTGNKIAIYGRKGYAVFNGSECVKYACKGVRITPEQIVAAANGDVIEYHQDAPTFGLDGSAKFITRHVRLT